MRGQKMAVQDAKDVADDLRLFCGNTLLWFGDRSKVRIREDNMRQMRLT